MLRNYAAVMAVLLICAPIGGGARLAPATYIDQMQSLRPVANWSPGPIELVLLCCCGIILCLIAPRLRA